MKRILSLVLIAAMLIPVQVVPVFADDAASALGSKLSTGLVHSVVLKEDGTVWTWGGNSCYELGDGTKISRDIPLQVKSIADAAAVSAGKGVTIVLKKDGTVWAWGDVHAKDIKNNISTPVKIKGLEDIIAISDRVALKKDGTVWEWGLKDKITNSYISPIQVKGLTDIVEIASNGGFVHLALKKDGTVMSWNYYGDDMFGALAEKTSEPVRVSNLSDVVSISAGLDYALALKNDGTVWTWGRDAWGKAVLVGGNFWYTDFKDCPIPAQIEDIAEVTRISAGDKLSTVLKKDGTVWQWGYLSYELKDGSICYEPSIKPKQLNGLANVAEISARFGHGVAIKNDGTVWEWSGSDSAVQIPVKR